MILYRVFKFDRCAKEWKKIRVFDSVDKAKEFIYRNWKDMDDMFYFDIKLYGKDCGDGHAGAI